MVLVMTLITYPTRVHFADDVLEEALQSELERDGLTAPLLIGPAPLEGSDIFERIQTGLLRSKRPVICEFSPKMGFPTQLELIERKASGQRVDVILAFGSARAIELGRRYRRREGNAVNGRMPFYVVPSVDGLPNPSDGNLESWRAGLPSLVICDPTLILGADMSASLRSAVMSFVRSIESYLSPAYNPTADGMAIDAFSRCISTIPNISTNERLAVRRELMAASLNASLSQEKGIGPTQILTGLLMDQRDDLDEAAIARLILPGASETMAGDATRRDILARLMGQGQHFDATGLRQFLSPLPFANRLSQLGITPQNLDTTICMAARRHNLPTEISRQILGAVF